MRRGRLLVISLVTVIALVAAACSKNNSNTSPTSGASAAPVTLTIWQNYGTESNATVLKNMADAYHVLHPNVTIKVVPQSGTNYFSLLQAAAVSKTGPDMAVMWTGLFTLQYKDFLQNLKGLVPDSAFAKVDPNALKWTADSFDAANGPYVMPLEEQFYIGFYNKAEFQKAGVTSVPTTWNELIAACQKLKTAGYIPMTYGNGGQPISTEFYPWYDMSYMMIGAYSVDQWKQLYSGGIPWTSPQIQNQLAQWSKLKSSGCTNQDVLTKTDNVTDFSSGKAAMIVDGTWNTTAYTDALKKNVAAFIPPFSNSPMKGVVDFAGDGLSIMNYSPNKQAAADFLTFMTTPQAVALINAGGLIPAITGSGTSNPVNQEMLNFVSQDGMIAYPMLDNVVQPDVTTTGNKDLPSVLNGTISPSKATTDMQSTFNQLPAAQRGQNYP